MTEKFYTTEQVAELLQVHTNTVRAWIKAGKLRAFQLPNRRGQYRIAEADLHAFLDGGAQGGPGDE